jgi:hypothetical protein
MVILPYMCPYMGMQVLGQLERLQSDLGLAQLALRQRDETIASLVREREVRSYRCSYRCSYMCRNL